MTEMITFVDAGRSDDTRKALGVVYGRHEIVLFLIGDRESENGKDLRRIRSWAEGAHVRVQESQTQEVLALLGTRGRGALPISAMEEIRVRTLIGRARKANPPPSPIPEPDPFLEEDTGETEERVREILARLEIGPPAATETGDTGTTVPEADDLDLLLDEAFADETPEVEDPVGATPDAGGGDAPVGGEADPDPDFPLSWDDLIWPERRGASTSQAGTSAAEKPVAPEPAAAVKEPAVPPLKAGFVFGRDKVAAIRALLEAVSAPRIYGLTATRLQSDLNHALKDPHEFFGAGRHDLYAVWPEAPSSEDRDLHCVLWLERVEYRYRIRAFTTGTERRMRERAEEAFSALIREITRYTTGPVEIMLPKSLLPPAQFLTCGNFRHVCDLPRWSWGDDVSLWMRDPRPSW
jgi:hypothetical protein